jgi:hypothetical protein
MKPLKNIFENRWKKKQVSFCCETLKLQLGNSQVDITKDEAEKILYYRNSGMGIIAIKYPVSLFLHRDKIRIDQKESVIMRDMSWQEHLDYEREVGHVVIDPPQVQVRPGEYSGPSHNS